MSVSFTILIRPDLHLCTFERIPGAFPVIPDDALITRRLSPGYVSAIQVAVMTAPKPPGTFIHLGTATPTGILVSVLGRELLATVNGQAVT